MQQLEQINQRLEQAGQADLLRAEDLGLGGAVVTTAHVDEVVVHRAHLPQHVSALSPAAGAVASADHLVHVMAAGSPTFPYIYGLFAASADSPGSDTRLLPVTLHTAQLQQISAHYHFRHRWGA